MLAVRAKVLGRAGLQGIAHIVTPDTLLRWYRRLVAVKYDGSRCRGPGRPRVEATIADLARKMATENPGWGYTRIRGALSNLGHDLGRNTIKRILVDAGLEPAPERSKRTSWKTFLKAHWGAVAATDFFTVEELTADGLVRRVLAPAWWNAPWAGVHVSHARCMLSVEEYPSEREPKSR